MAKYISALEKEGLYVVQKGEYRRGNGRYAYFDSKDHLKMYFELLESDD